MDDDGFNKSKLRSPSRRIHDSEARATSKNPNDPSDLEDQKNNPSTVVPHSRITGRTGFTKRCDTAVMNVSVIEPIKNKI
jgi:hypothetical protein